MSKRIKTVFPSDQVLHLWANQTQDNARSANVFFEGDTCYSYGYHYKLGKLHKVNGVTIALINSRFASVTTRKHQSYATQAVSHLLSLNSSDVNSIETALQENLNRIVDACFNHFNTIAFYDADVTYYMDEIKAHNRIVEVTKLKQFRIDLDDDFFTLMQDHVKLRIQRKAELNAIKNTPEEIAKRERAVERKIELEREKLALNIENWRKGGALMPAMRSIRPQLIRIRGELVETTNGANVPLDGAKAMLARILEGTLNQEGETIGGFELIKIEHNTVTIGCHTIELSEARAVFAGVLCS